MKQYDFYKSNDQWFIDLPEYLAQGGDQSDLQMVAGADVMLDNIACGKRVVRLQTDTEPFPGFGHFILTRTRNPQLTQSVSSGAFYYATNYVNYAIWLCDVTKWVFDGEFPDILYCKPA